MSVLWNFIYYNVIAFGSDGWCCQKKPMNQIKQRIWVLTVLSAVYWIQPFAMFYCVNPACLCAVLIWHSSAPVPLNQSLIIPIYSAWTIKSERGSLKTFCFQFKMDAVLNSATISDRLPFIKHTLGFIRPCMFHFYVWNCSVIQIDHSKF